MIQTKINRRKFLQNTAMGSAAMLLTPAFTSAASVFTAEGKLSNLFMTGLTPISIIDNACMLAFASGKLSLESNAVVTTDIHLRNTPGNKGRLAVVFPPQDKKIMELVQTVKTNSETKFAKEKRALVFGWAAINAVDQHINLPLKEKSSEEALLCRFHQDGLVIQGFSSPEYYVQGASRQDMEDLLNAMLVRTITRIHTLKPDSEDGIGWVNRMAEWRRTNKANTAKFAAAIVSPDSHQAGNNFYSIHEDIIVTSNNLQKAKKENPDKIMEVVNAGGASHYGKALADATQGILAIDAFLNDKISSGELEKRLHLT